MSLGALTTDKLVALGKDNGVAVDGRNSRETIISKLEAAGVEAPDLFGGTELTDRVAAEPVRFIGTIGSIRVRNAQYDNALFAQGGGKHLLDAGLVVYFKNENGNGDPVGGFSREFYPDMEEHRSDDENCDCAKCLADVRDYLVKNGTGARLAAEWHIREAQVNEPFIPFGGWDNVNAGDIQDLHDKGAVDDLANAVRYEKANANRADVLAALNTADERATTVDDTDILDAEIEV